MYLFVFVKSSTSTHFTALEFVLFYVLLLLVFRFCRSLDQKKGAQGAWQNGSKVLKYCSACNSFGHNLSIILNNYRAVALDIAEYSRASELLDDIKMAVNHVYFFDGHAIERYSGGFPCIDAELAIEFGSNESFDRLSKEEVDLIGTISFVSWNYGIITWGSFLSGKEWVHYAIYQSNRWTYVSITYLNSSACSILWFFKRLE